MTTDNKSSLFRRVAEAAQRFQPFGEIALISPVPLTILTIATAAVAVGVALLLTFGSYTRRATADGVVMPDTGLVKVYAQKSGDAELQVSLPPDGSGLKASMAFPSAERERLLVPYGLAQPDQHFNYADIPLVPISATAIRNDDRTVFQQECC